MTRNNNNETFAVPIPEDAPSGKTKAVLFSDGEPQSVIAFNPSDWSKQKDGSYFPLDGVQHTLVADNVSDVMAEYQTEIQAILQG